MASRTSCSRSVRIPEQRNTPVGLRKLGTTGISCTITPATICRIPNKGLLRPGYDADVVIFDPDVNVSHTIIGGRVVYEAK